MSVAGAVRIFHNAVMKIHPVQLIVAILLALTGMAIPSSAAEAIRFDPALLSGPTTTIDTTVPDEIVVRFKDDTTPVSSDFSETKALRGSSLERTWKVKVKNKDQRNRIMEQLRSNPRVDYVEPNGYARIMIEPDDPSLSAQWHHSSTIGAKSREAWDTETGSADVVIAVIDGGADADHDDLNANLWTNPGDSTVDATDNDANGYTDDIVGYDFVSNDANINPDPDGLDDDGDGVTDGGVNHGSHVAGIIGAVGDNATGIAGINWDVSLMILKSMDDEGLGSYADIAEAVDYAVDNGADIINMSLGGTFDSATLRSSIADAVAAGVLVVAAAGNGDEDGDPLDLNTVPHYPVCYDGVVGVTSLTTLERPSSFSNYGTDCADVAAPGSSVYSTLYTDDAPFGFTSDYGFLSGTSMASPVVAGVAGLLLADDPTLTDTKMASMLTQTTDTDLDDQFNDNFGEGAYGPGRVDAEAALAVECFDGSDNVVAINTFYRDEDEDGLGDPAVTTTSCSASVPEGYVTDNSDTNDDDADNDGVVTASDCNDDDATVSEDQTYYEDADNDGLGNPAVSTTLCAGTAPDGYVDNADDADDTPVETIGDGIDNDGDGEVDEKITEPNPGYEDNDPSDPEVFAASVASIDGGKKGNINITYADGSTYQVKAFNSSSSQEVVAKSFNDLGYIVALAPKGKFVKLINVYTGETLKRIRVSKKTWKKTSVKFRDIKEDGNLDTVVTLKNAADVRVVTIRVFPAREDMEKKDGFNLTRKKINPAKTKLTKNQIRLRKTDGSVLRKVHVSKKYNLSLVEE